MGQMAEATTDSRDSGAGSEADRLDRLRRFLSAYWLRPENALWMTLRSLALDQCRLRGPSIDVACGDGVFSFLHRGGKLADDFDVFLGAGHLDRVGRDHADMFDFMTDRYTPRIERRPDRGYDVGCDHKPALLHKAQSLGLYGRLVPCDCNEALPFVSGSFASVYCNSVYWVREVDGFLRELRRIARPDGEVILHVKLEEMRRCTLARLRPQLGDRFLEIIDRGRAGCWPSLATRSCWEARFERAGFDIAEATPFVTETHAHLWDVGLRPVAPLLVRMANGLEPATRGAIKRDWVALLLELLAPLCRFDLDLSSQRGSKPVEMQYVLRPKG